MWLRKASGEESGKTEWVSSADNCGHVRADAKGERNLLQTAWLMNTLMWTSEYVEEA